VLLPPQGAPVVRTVGGVMRGGSKGEGERTGMRGRIVEGREEKR
jgi:hypothetical protein